jgi:hypothetical protein
MELNDLDSDEVVEYLQQDFIVYLFYSTLSGFFLQELIYLPQVALFVPQVAPVVTHIQALQAYGVSMPWY